MSDVIRTVKPSLIINPAVYTAVDKAESEPDLTMRINGEAPGVMAEEAKKLGVAMIHYSTDYVFVDAQNRPCSEGDPACPINVYGAAKLAGEPPPSCRHPTPVSARQLGLSHARQLFLVHHSASGTRARSMNKSGGRNVQAFII